MKSAILSIFQNILKKYHTHFGQFGNILPGCYLLALFMMCKLNGYFKNLPSNDKLTTCRKFLCFTIPQQNQSLKNEDEDKKNIVQGFSEMIKYFAKFSSVDNIHDKEVIWSQNIFQNQ